MDKKYLSEALRSLEIADHMFYVSYLLIQDKKLLLKIFIELHKSVINLIKFVVSGNCEVNDLDFILKKFFEKDACEIGLNNEQTKKIKEIIFLGNKYQNSAIEFVRNEKVVIMSKNLNIEVIDVKKIKDYLNIVKFFYSLIK